jgi:diguanylate cyclase (GGDEF)-like protein
MDPAHVDIPRRLRVTTITAGLLSATLGTWGFALLYFTNAAEKPFVPLFVGFASIACAYCLACLPRAAVLTNFFGSVPVCLALLLSGSNGQIAIAVSLILNMGLVGRLIADQFSHFRTLITAHAQVQSLAYVDPLTGLANRRSLYERLEDAVQQHLIDGSGFSLAMMDLDDFKSINDSYGHPVGDKLLVEAASRIHAQCPSCSTISRQGGDEFAILVPRDGDARIDELGKRLATSLAEPFVLGHARLHLSASIGIAHCPEHGTDAATIMSRADVALYRVKYAGGGGVQTFRPEFEDDLHRRTAIEQALRETEPYPDVKLVYQPVCDTLSGEITTFEALARWEHPTLGPVEPTEFIAAAERTGTISALSERIFDTALRAAASWPASTSLSLNLSAVQLRDPATPLMIMSLLHKHDFAPTRLELEVTETSVLTDVTASREMLDLLRSTGLRVVLDDFGAGFASIGYLKEITFDRLKIDGGIIDTICHSPRAKDLLAGILELCRTMSIPATAERVETKEQLAILRQLRCDRVQGYLLGKPVEAHWCSKAPDLCLQGPRG